MYKIDIEDIKAGLMARGDMMRQKLDPLRHKMVPIWMKMKLLRPVKVLALCSAVLLVMLLAHTVGDSQTEAGAPGRQRRNVEEVTHGASETSVVAAVYTRWGHDDCSGDAQLVYKGVVGGSHYSHTGDGANNLCLPHNPTLGPSSSGTDYATVRGAEYQSLNELYGRPLENQNVPCAVCKIQRSVVMMLPGRNACYDGWNIEYKGYLVSAHYSHQKSEYVCMDEDPQLVEGGHSNENGVLMYPVLAKCGSLPCPEYEDHTVLTCAVCSV